MIPADCRAKSGEEERKKRISKELAQQRKQPEQNIEA